MKNSKVKIITSHDYPPIPMRNFDWSAFREDYEYNYDTETGDLVGNGKTEQEAIKYLKSQELDAIDYGLIDDIELEINGSYPNFVDTFIVSADYDGRPMTDEELNYLNEDSDFVYEQAMKFYF